MTFNPFHAPISPENEAYLTQQIITYLGNKRALLDFIRAGVDMVKERLGKDKLTTLDIFSGSGIVSRFLKQHSSCVMANDLEYYSSVINNCFLTNDSPQLAKRLQDQERFLHDYIEKNFAPGFISELYAPVDQDHITAEDRVFYSKRNACYIDTARQAINLLPEEDRPFFLAPLLSQASIHNNTSGVFKGFYKNKKGIGTYGGNAQNALTRILGEIKIQRPVLSSFQSDFQVFQEDANTLIQHIDEVDLVYMDPPYNQHPYGSNYFMLNVIAEYKYPENISKISGIPQNWNRSAYNKIAHVRKALFSLIEQCPAKFVLLSYSSEGFITLREFIDALFELGKVDILDVKYNTFRASRNYSTRPNILKEYLFLIQK